MADSKGGACTLRTRKMMKNPLLARRQMVRGEARTLWSSCGA